MTGSSGISVSSAVMINAAGKLINTVRPMPTMPGRTSSTDMKVCCWAAGAASIGNSGAYSAEVSERTRCGGDLERGVLVAGLQPAEAGDRSRVTLSVAFGGFLGRLIGRMMRGLNERYLAQEAAGLKQRSEALRRYL